MIKVLLVDDQEVIRTVLDLKLKTAGDMRVVATASNGQEALEQAIFHDPDVVLMDIYMPIMDGLEATKKISQQCPKTRIVILSAFNASLHILRSLRAGASGYVLKDMLAEDLLIAVRSASRGERYFSKQIREIAKLYI